MVPNQDIHDLVVPPPHEPIPTASRTRTLRPHHGNAFHYHPASPVVVDLLVLQHGRRQEVSCRPTASGDLAPAPVG